MSSNLNTFRFTAGVFVFCLVYYHVVCLLYRVWHCDHRVGEGGAGFFGFLD